MAEAFNVASMATPGEMLEEVLKARGITTTQFSEMVRERFKTRHDYNAIKKWIYGRGFNRKNQAYAEEILGLDPGHFAGETEGEPRQDPIRFASLRAYFERLEAANQPVIGGARTYLIRAQALVVRDPGERWWLNQHLLYQDMDRNAPQPDGRRS